jgi:tetratricopeptide (TPR) repeat protein
MSVLLRSRDELTVQPHVCGLARILSWRDAGRIGLSLAVSLSLAMTLVCVGAGGMPAARAAPDPIKGEVRVENDNGFTRLVFRLAEAVDAKVRKNGAILVINFNKSVAVSVDRINAGAPNVISAARSDPDGGAVRIALAKKVRLSVIPAAERLYVDLLPPNWEGPVPGLPQDVVDELANRARQAEHQLQKHGLIQAKKATPTIRVKVAKLPTFMRYIFEMPEYGGVRPEQAKGKLTLRFDQQIKWDMADAIATMPETVRSIEAEADFNQVAVIFKFKGSPEVRSFREDRSIVVDVGLGDAIDAAKPKLGANPGAKAGAEMAVKSGAKGEVKAEPKIGAKPDSGEGAAPQLAAADQGPAIAAPETVPVKGTPLVKDVPAPNEAAQEMAKDAAAPKLEMKAAAKPEAGPAKNGSTHEAQDPPAKPATEMAAHAQTVPAKAENGASAPKAMGKPPAPDPTAPVKAAVNQSSEELRVTFPFAVPTPAAVFRRADTLWLVFDSVANVDVAALAQASPQTIRQATSSRGQDGEAIVRIRLVRPQLASLDSAGPTWVVTIGDNVTVPTQPLTIERGFAGRSGASMTIAFDNPAKVHQIEDPDIGDRLMVITALGPARGFLKPQYFVELRALSSTQGVVLQPIADDVAAWLEADKITVGRPGGLSLSATTKDEQQQQMSAGYMALTFDTEVWAFDRKAPFNARQSELIRIAAAAPENTKREARYNLARFYLAREMGAEARAVLDVAMSEQDDANDVTGNILKAIADVILGRPERALKALSAPQIGNQLDAPIWRAIAYARQGQWPKAHAGFKAVDSAIRTLPVDLQRMAMQEEMRSAIEVRDFADATRAVNELEAMGIPPEQQPAIDVLSGRLFESLGRKEEALIKYRTAAASSERPAAAAGRLREIAMLMKSGNIPRKEAIHELETLTTVWRGDETETEGLRMLAHLYTEDSRYRDAFHVMRTALLAHPNSDATRKIQDEAAATFGSLFLAGKGDALPPIEALGLFYDFRELTPIGRRGDEMIRRLADRLVSVDLLDQATELLKHQVDHRLHGAARAQVATKLAVIHLMNHKPDQALAMLQKTRTADLSNESRDQRLLLEARAMSDIGRHELALEVIANIKGRQAIRLRANILWVAKHWRKAAEQIELLLGDRWKQFTPLAEGERADVLRAAVGYALSDEKIGLMRLREKFSPKMADGPDRRDFDIVSSVIGTDAAEFQDIARKVASSNTLEGFLRDMRQRYPDQYMPAAKDAPPPRKPADSAKTPKVSAHDAAPKPAKAGKEAMSEATPAAELPKIPKGVPLKPDRMPTGSIGPRVR